MTTKRKELSAFEYGEIIGAWKCNLSENKIAQGLDHPSSIVHDIISVYKNFGFETMPPRGGRPPIMTERNGWHLERTIKENRWTNLQEITDNFVSFTSTNICTKTVKYYLYNHGFYGQIGVKKPLVTESNRKKRFLWAKKHENWKKEWDNVIWSNEARFELFKSDGRKYV